MSFIKQMETIEIYGKTYKKEKIPLETYNHKKRQSYTPPKMISLMANPTHGKIEHEYLGTPFNVVPMYIDRTEKYVTIYTEIKNHSENNYSISFSN